MLLEQQAGLYVHVPFCHRKCSYCSFFSTVPRAGDRDRFCSALLTQMQYLAAQPEVQCLGFATIFFGGGTPSVFPASVLSDLLHRLRHLFSCSTPDPEITVEVNPGTIDGAALSALRRAGFNRLSIGVQSLVDRELAALGRMHSSREALAAILAARRAGFDNLSFDLMYGLPQQTVSSWQATLDRALDLQPQHLSMYELTVEEGTPLAAQAQADPRLLPPEEEVLAMMAATATAVAGSSLQRYEISNYAEPGSLCRHNVNYWNNGCYVGLGPAAVSAFGGVRRTAVADLDEFSRRVLSGLPVWEDVESLDREAAFRETVVIGLRMLAGVSVTALQDRFGLDLPTYYGSHLDQLIGQGLLTLHQDRLCLTLKGLPVANQVLSALV